MKHGYFTQTTIAMLTTKESNLMNGKIVAIGKQNDFVAIRMNDEQLCIIEASEFFDIDDVILGNLTCNGSELLYNKTKKYEFSAIVQFVYCDWPKVIEVLNL